MNPYYQKENITVYQGNVREVLPAIGIQVDHVVTDPPYGLSFMEAGWDQAVPGPEYWQAIKNVCKPGASVLAFGGTRTFHRLTCAMEDAGWEIHDCLMWLYGQGFPKSLDIGKAIDKAAGAEREVVGRYQPPGMEKPWNLRNAKDRRTVELFASSRNNLDITAPATDAAKQWQGWGTALKPAWEPIVLGMNPLDGTFAANAEKHGVAGLNIDGCRITTSENLNGGAYTSNGTTRDDGWGMRRGGAGPFEQPSGRFPANLLLDEDTAQQLDSQTGTLKSGTNCVRTKPGDGYHGGMGQAGDVQVSYGDAGDTSRFFYCSKASKKERGPGNDHPTVKPIGLMKYLLTLLSTPTGGLILDAFAGSGTTAVAAKELGRPCVCVELDGHNCEIIARRLEALNV
jgi:site-specific DNA-methyltransferase (adenine-specific)